MSIFEYNEEEEMKKIRAAEYSVGWQAARISREMFKSKTPPSSAGFLTALYPFPLLTQEKVPYAGRLLNSARCPRLPEE